MHVCSLICFLEDNPLLFVIAIQMVTSNLEQLKVEGHELI
jgi:hypothetical protein